MQRERIYLFDNLKAVLILLVVLGHFAELFSGESHSMQALFIFIYTFHMPLFIFISGLLHREYQPGDPLQRGRFVSFLLIALCLKLLLAAVRLVLTGSGAFHLLSEDGIPWYLLALAAYELIIYLIRGYKPSIILPIAILLSCFVGYDSSIGDYLTLSRIVVYLPFFLMGYYMKPERILAFSKHIAVKIAAAVVLFAYILFCWLQTDWIYRYRRLFTGRNSFASAAEKLPNAGIQDRVLVILLALLIGFAVICVVPNIRIKGLTRIGSCTLQIYFWHRVILYILTWFNWSVLLRDILGGAAGKAAYLLSAALLTIILSSALFSHPTKELLQLERHPRDKKQQRHSS